MRKKVIPLWKRTAARLNGQLPTVTTARPLDDGQRSRLFEKLGSFNEQVSRHIIGGLIVRTNTILVDASLSGKLNRLREKARG